MVKNSKLEDLGVVAGIVHLRPAQPAIDAQVASAVHGEIEARRIRGINGQIPELGSGKRPHLGPGAYSIVGAVELRLMPRHGIEDIGVRGRSFQPENGYGRKTGRECPRALDIRSHVVVDEDALEIQEGELVVIVRVDVNLLQVDPPLLET
jgi:hypothetical protein